MTDWVPERQPTRPKKGRKPAFTAEDVVQAALAEGIDRFTLSSVAGRLGVVTGAIYRLFDSRDAILNACLDVAARSLALPQPGMGWRELLQQWADENWRICEDYPGLARVLYSYAPAPAHVTDVVATYTDTLEGLGKTRGQALFALDFLGDTVVATHLSIDTMREIQDSATGLDRYRLALGDDHAGFPPDDSWVTTGTVAIKVAFILNGLEQQWPEL